MVFYKAPYKLKIICNCIFDICMKQFVIYIIIIIIIIINDHEMFVSITVYIMNMLYIR